MNKSNNKQKGSFTWVNQDLIGEYFAAKYPIYITWWRKILNKLGFKKDHTTLTK